jgi:tetratricopeptide (TPR) repeat protein
MMGGGVVLVATAIVALGWSRWKGDQVETRVCAAVERRDYAAAHTLVAGWVASEPNSAAAHFWQGRIFAETDKPEQALGELDKARALGYPEPPMERVVGIVMAKGGRQDQAEAMLLSDLARNPSPDAPRDEALARMYVAQLRLGPAWEALDRWARAAPKDPQPWLMRAKVAEQTSASASTITDAYREALTRDSSLDAARLGLANALRTQGQYEQALAEYETYLKRHSHDAGALAGAGLAALANGAEADAGAYFDRALQADPNQLEALNGRASIAMRRRDNAAALPLLERSIQFDANQPDAHYRRSLALEALGRTDEARAERDITDRLRRDAKELDTLRKQVLKASRDPDQQTRLARWLFEHGRPEEGLVWAERVMATPGRHPEAAALLADHYQRTGNAARANYYRALAGSPK